MTCELYRCITLECPVGERVITRTPLVLGALPLDDQVWVSHHQQRRVVNSRATRVS